MLRTNGSSVTAAPESATGVLVPPVYAEPDEAVDAEPVDVVELPEPDEPIAAADVPELQPPPDPAPPAAEREPNPAAQAEPDEIHAVANEVRQEILREVRQMARSQTTEEFSLWRLVGTIVQVLVVPVVGLTLSDLLKAEPDLARAQVWGTIAVILQVMALTLAMHQRKR